MIEHFRAVYTVCSGGQKLTYLHSGRQPIYGDLACGSASGFKVIATIHDLLLIKILSLSLSFSPSLSLILCLACVRACVRAIGVRACVCVFLKGRTICVAFSHVMRCVDLIASYALSHFLKRKSTVYQIRAIQCIMKKSFVHL